MQSSYALPTGIDTVDTHSTDSVLESAGSLAANDETTTRRSLSAPPTEVRANTTIAVPVASVEQQQPHAATEPVRVRFSCLFSNQNIFSQGNSLHASTATVATATSLPAPTGIHLRQLKLLHYNLITPHTAEECQRAQVPLLVRCIVFLHVESELTGGALRWLLLRNVQKLRRLRSSTLAGWLCVEMRPRETFILQLLDRYQNLAGCHGNKRLLPYFAGKARTMQIRDDNWQSVWVQQLAEITQYI